MSAADPPAMELVFATESSPRAKVDNMSGKCRGEENHMSGDECFYAMARCTGRSLAAEAWHAAAATDIEW